MNSHIQMPKCVLKQFANEDHVLYYYNFKDGHIAKNSATSINTEKIIIPMIWRCFLIKI